MKRLRDLWETIRCSKIHVTGVPEIEEGEKQTQRIFEQMMSKNFSYVKKNMNLPTKNSTISK